jgi:hypothetical protein
MARLRLVVASVQVWENIGRNIPPRKMGVKKNAESFGLKHPQIG